MPTSPAALFIAEINPLRWVQQSGELPRDPRDNIYHFDAVWFTEYIRDWQTKTSYAQKWQYNDWVAVYLDANTFTAPTVKLMDCYGRTWHTWTLDLIATGQAGIKVGNAVVAANTWYKRFRLSEVSGLPEGIYWFVQTVPYDLDNSGTAETFRHNISEPISIATLHRGTSRVDYYNTFNAFDVLFSLGVKFSQRLEADIVDYSPASTDIQTEDGASNAEMLSSLPYRVAKYALTRRVPEWLLLKLNWAWACNRVKVDSLGFTKEIGGKFEVGRLARHPGVYASLPIREADNKQGGRQIYLPSFTVFTATPPYALISIALIDSAGEYFYDTANTPVVAHNNTEADTFVTAFNVWAAAQGFAGTLSRASTTYTWTNGAGDVFVAGAAKVFVDPLEITLTTTNIAQPVTFNAPDVLVDFGDGSNVRVVNAGTAATGAHIYGSSGTWDMLIFGTYTSISFDDGFLDTVGGDVPAGLLRFILTNSFTITSFDCDVLANADATLILLSVNNCSALATITNLFNLTLPSQQLVNFSGCGLNSTQASNVVINIDFMASAGPLLYRNLYVNNNSGGTATMNALGASAKSNLIVNRGWNVITD